MARDGSGNYSRVEGPYVNGNVADADEMNAELDDIGSALSDSINKAGTKAMAANLPMGGFKVTGLGAAASNGDAVRYEQLTGLSATYQPIDATLTALAALSWSSGNALFQMTAADTVSLTLAPSVTNLTLSGVLSAPDGTAAAPSVKVGDEQNGLYSSASGTLSFATAGAVRFEVSSGLVNFSAGSVVGRFAAGTVGAPIINIRAADTDTGLWSPATDTWAWSAAGVEQMRWSATLVQFVPPVQAGMALSTETSGTLTSASANKYIAAAGGITLPNSVFSAGNWQRILAGSASRTITRGSGIAMYVNGADASSATLAARGMMEAFWTDASTVYLSGDVA